MSVQRLIDDTIRQVATRAHAVFVRSPPIDALLPETSDVDFVVFADVDDLQPERLWRSGDDRERLVDLTWLPAAWLNDPEALAAHGLIAHRLASSELVFARSDRVAAQWAAAAGLLYRADIHRKRLGGFFEMGALTVREIGVTWEFPALALFWLHMAHAACLAAALDGGRRLCPNVYTRPLDYLAELDRRLGADLAGEWAGALGLDADPADAIAALRRVHAIVAPRFPEPAWAPSMRMTTRLEYRYWRSGAELEWRIRVAEEMCRRGRRAAAVYFLRFHAYALARVPMVHARAGEGRDVSYLRPEKAVRPELERLCPDIVDDLSVVLSGVAAPPVAAVARGLVVLDAFRARVIDALSAAGAPMPPLAPWIPYQRPSPDVAEALCQT